MKINGSIGIFNLNPTAHKAQGNQAISNARATSPQYSGDTVHFGKNDANKQHKAWLNSFLESVLRLNEKKAEKIASQTEFSSDYDTAEEEFDVIKKHIVPDISGNLPIRKISTLKEMHKTLNELQKFPAILELIYDLRGPALNKRTPEEEKLLQEGIKAFKELDKSAQTALVTKTLNVFLEGLIK